MPASSASTVDEYLAALPDDRRAAISTVRDAIVRHLPEGYHEGMGWGMIGWTVPLERYPKTYNGQPLMFAGLVSNKAKCALHFVPAYADPAVLERVRDAFARAGTKLDRGKGCIHFRTADDLPLDALGEIVASLPPDAFIAGLEAAREAAARERGAKKRG